ncbi:MAG: DUF979 domain-containing protein [Acidobacteria bacterium]|nr:DUF979 domain-containing protein [Acidobacteriota bacterium]
MPSLTNITAALFSLDTVYVLTGLVLWVFAALNFRDRANANRASSAFFWLVLGIIFALGSVMPHWLTGVLVLLMVGLDGAGRVGLKPRKGETTKTGQVAQKERTPGNKIFLPVLLIPLLAFGFALAFRLFGGDTSRGALVGLGFGGAAALGAGLALTKGRAREAFDEGRRLNDSMGSVIILPQLLASLGVIFAASRVGDLIAAGIKGVIPGENLFLLVAANCLGMTLFTLVMGNSFAAFPVITAGVLVPLIIKPFGVDPAMAAIVTLTAGSTGTLMTPMAANFNIVPAALLSMRDQYAVIKFQVPFALTMWVLHVLVLWLMIRLL